MEKRAFVDFMKTASPDQKARVYEAVARAAFRDELEKTAGWGQYAQNAWNTTRRVGGDAWKWAKNNKLELGLTAASLALPIGWGALGARLGAGALARYGLGAATKGLAHVARSRVAGGMLRRGATKALAPGGRMARAISANYGKRQAARQALGASFRNPGAAKMSLPGVPKQLAKPIAGSGKRKAFVQSFKKPSRKQVALTAAPLALTQTGNVTKQVTAPGIRSSTIAPAAKGWVG